MYNKQINHNPCKLTNKKRSNQDYCKEIKITQLILCNEDGEPTNEFNMGDKIIFKLQRIQQQRQLHQRQLHQRQQLNSLLYLQYKISF